MKCRTFSIPPHTRSRGIHKRTFSTHSLLPFSTVSTASDDNDYGAMQLIKCPIAFNVLRSVTKQCHRRRRVLYNYRTKRCVSKITPHHCQLTCANVPNYITRVRGLFHAAYHSFGKYANVKRLIENNSGNSAQRWEVVT